MQVALIYNLKSPGGRLARIATLAQALEARGHTVSRHDSMAFRSPADAPEADVLCICGGDGTVRLVADSYPDLSLLPPLAIYPVGTINLLARELDYPIDPQAFVKRIERDQPLRKSAVAMANGRRFLACASVGGDAWAVAAMSAPLKAQIGRFAYVAAMARIMRDWPRPALRITADGEALEAEALFVLRGAYYAGPWTLDREANLGRELLHVLVLPHARLRDLLAVVRYALTGSHRPNKAWRFLRVSELHAEADTEVPFQIDGDFAGHAPVAFAISDHKVQWK